MLDARFITETISRVYSLQMIPSPERQFLPNLLISGIQRAHRDREYVLTEVGL